MTVSSATLLPLYLQRIREYVNVEDTNIRGETWKALAEPVSTLEGLRGTSDFNSALGAFTEEESEVYQELVKSYPSRADVPHSVNQPGSPKLAEYASAATLPSMHWKPRTKGNTTVREPDNKRNLRSVRQIRSKEFFGRVLSYQKARPPSDSNRFPEALRVPHPNYPFVQTAGCTSARARPESEEVVASWVQWTALETALCLFHNAEAQYGDWVFGKPRKSKKGLSDMVFKSNPVAGSAPSDVERLLVEVKCPWTLPLAEMKEIVKHHNGLPNLSELEAVNERTTSPRKVKKPAYTSGEHLYHILNSSFVTSLQAQRVLAQVYDYCREQKHQFFIITTYEYWMFGVFSQDYTLAAVTEPLPYDHKGPTILQCITYWLQSSLFLPGSFEIPEITTTGDNAEPPSLLSTSSMWRRTIQRWRTSSIKDLRLNTELSQHSKTKKLMSLCTASLTKLDTPPTSPTSYHTDLLARCRGVMHQIEPQPSGQPEWTVVLTWLALVLDPVTFDHDLQSLEDAFWFEAVFDQDHPITKDHAHMKRKLSFESRRARAGQCAGTVQLNNSWGEGKGFHDPYLRFVSREVAIILNRYLPIEIRRELQRWYISAQPAPAPQNPKAQPKNYPGISARYSAPTRLPGRRIVSETRCIIAPPKPPQLEPQRRKPRASEGTRAEIRIPLMDTRGGQRSLDSAPCSPLLGDYGERNDDEDGYYLVTEGGRGRTPEYQPNSPHWILACGRSLATQMCKPRRKSAIHYPIEVFQQSGVLSEASSEWVNRTSDSGAYIDEII